MFTTVSHTIARSVIGALGAVILATTFIVAATGPAEANAATATVSAPATSPLA